MHLWPSLKVRDSFKIDHLRKIERYNSGKKQPLLKEGEEAEEDSDQQQSQHVARKLLSCPNFMAIPYCRDLLLIFSCCFCFGIFHDEDKIDYI